MTEHDFNPGEYFKPWPKKKKLEELRKRDVPDAEGWWPPIHINETDPEILHNRIEDMWHYYTEEIKTLRKALIDIAGDNVTEKHGDLLKRLADE